MVWHEIRFRILAEKYDIMVFARKTCFDENLVFFFTILTKNNNFMLWRKTKLCDFWKRILRFWSENMIVQLCENFDFCGYVKEKLFWWEIPVWQKLCFFSKIHFGENIHFYWKQNFMVLTETCGLIKEHNCVVLSGKKQTDFKLLVKNLILYNK